MNVQGCMLVDSWDKTGLDQRRILAKQMGVSAERLDGFVNLSAAEHRALKAFSAMSLWATNQVFANEAVKLAAWKALPKKKRDLWRSKSEALRDAKLKRTTKQDLEDPKILSEMGADPRPAKRAKTDDAPESKSKTKAVSPKIEIKEIKVVVPPEIKLPKKVERQVVPEVQVDDTIVRPKSREELHARALIIRDQLIVPLFDIWRQAEIELATRERRPPAHAIVGKPWHIQFSDSHQQLTTWSHDTREYEISSAAIMALPVAEIKILVEHDIAHLLSLTQMVDHGFNFDQACRRVGIPNEECQIVRPSLAKYKWICNTPLCTHVGFSHGVLRKWTLCSKCPGKELARIPNPDRLAGADCFLFGKLFKHEHMSAEAKVKEEARKLKKAAKAAKKALKADSKVDESKVVKTAGFAKLPEIIKQTAKSITFKVVEKGVPCFVFEGIHYFVSTLGKSRGFSSRHGHSDGSDGNLEFIVNKKGSKSSASAFLYAADWAHFDDDEDDDAVEQLEAIGIKLKFNWLDGPRKKISEMTSEEFWAMTKAALDGPPSKGLEFTVSF